MLRRLADRSIVPRNYLLISPETGSLPRSLAAATYTGYLRVQVENFVIHYLAFLPSMSWMTKSYFR